MSRDAGQPANAIFHPLRDSGHEVVPINPQTGEVDGVTCYPDLASIPGTVEGVMIATRGADGAASHPLNSPPARPA